MTKEQRMKDKQTANIQRTNGVQTTNKRRTNNEQTTNKQQTKDEQTNKRKTNKHRANDEGFVGGFQIFAFLTNKTSTRIVHRCVIQILQN
jgi:hypothetical protein